MKKLYFLSLFFLLGSYLQAQVIQADKDALIALYTATDGANWTTSTNWNTAEPVASWYGVTVSGDGTRVEQLNLSFNNLNGIIPAAIGDLTALNLLYMYSNQLSGDIPTELNGLTALTAIDLHENQLTSIPAGISALTALSHLDLGNNQLSGSIPTELASITALTYLDLSQNQYSGAIPVEIGGLTSLTFLSLGLNQLTGSIPTQFGVLTNLQYLYLNSTQMSGTIPAEIGGMTSLFLLDLSYNQFSGTLPTEMAALTGLNYLIINDNQFDGLPDLTALTNLSSLQIENNLFDYADFEATGLDFSAISSVTYVPQNTDAQIIRTDNAGEITLSTNIGGTSNVYQWQNFASDMAGETNPTLVLATDAVGSYDLTLSNPNFPALTFDFAPVEVNLQNGVVQADYDALVALYNSTTGASWTTSTNWLSAEQVSTWFGVTVVDGRVTEINLNTNNLVGTIPASIGDLTGLTSLYISGNELSGNIPVEVGQLTNLHFLYLDNNQFSGNIPIEIGNLTNLRKLYLYFNQLSGSIPAELWTLTTLTDLRLGHNQFTGTIPAAVGDLNALTSLSFDHNQLSGSIAVEMNLLTALTYLNISDNQFDGLPDLSALTSLSYIYVQNNLFDYADFETANVNWAAITNKAYAPQNTDAQIIRTDNVGDITLSTNIGGTANVYQWQNFASDMAGETNPTLVLALDDTGKFDLTLTNSTYPDLTFDFAPVEVNLQNGVAQKDYDALVALYNSTNGASWTNSTNWISAELVSTWQGVTVVDGRVTEINLSNNNMAGTIPASIGDLTSLTSLWLYGNQLTGSIPAELWTLTTLTDLRFGYNQFTGTIPAAVGDLTSLTNLSFDHNQLSGSISAEMNLLTALTYLNISDNQFDGLPDLSALTSLSYLYVQNNLFDYADLETANVNWAAITDNAYAPQNTDAQIIRTDNAGDITLSTNIGGTSNVYQWQNFASDMAGETNPTLVLATDAVGSYDLTLSNPNFPDLTFDFALLEIGAQNGVIQADYDALVALYNSTNGASWTNSTNWLSAEPVSTWYGVTVVDGRATEINLAENNLVGSIPAEIGNLTALIRLYLHSNQLSGSIPVEIGQLTNLVSLFIDNNNFTGNIPTQIGQLGNLVEIHAQGNEFIGNIPMELGQLTNLQILKLYSNKLEGNIPSEIWNLTNLFDLRLSFNQLTGTLPNEIGNLTNLSIFYIGDNQFSGTIPETIGNLVNLEYVGLQNCGLEGAMPSSITNLTNLKDLWLYRNKLGGNFPIFNNETDPRIVVWNNNYTFEGAVVLERNTNTGTQYSPQNNFEVSPSSFVKAAGDNLYLDAKTLATVNLGSGNMYEWFKDGVSLGAASTGSSYAKTNITADDLGIYQCKVTNSYAPDLELWSEEIPVGTVMSVAGIETSHFGTEVVPGEMAKILSVNIQTQDIASPKVVEQFTFSTNGSTDVSDFENIKLWYSADDETFSNPTELDVLASADGTFTFTTTQQLAEGNNYFGITYEVKSTAVVGNVLDAECNSMLISGETVVPTTQAPAGNVAIVGKRFVSFMATQADGENVLAKGSTATVFNFEIYTVGDGTLEFQGINFNSLNTDDADVIADGVKLWSADDAMGTNPVLLGTTSFNAGIASFSGLTHSINTTESYFFVTYDLAADATAANVLDLEYQGNSLLLGGNTYEADAISPEQFFTVLDNPVTAYPYHESFEKGTGVWVQSMDDNADWMRYTGGNPYRSYSGPSDASEGSFYMTNYDEWGSGYSAFYLDGNFDFSALSNPILTFDYHMFVTGDVSLSVDIFDGSTWTNDVLKFTGPQQTSELDSWKTVSKSLSDFAGVSNVTIRFRANTIEWYQSTLGVDNIKLEEAPATDMSLVSVTATQNNQDAVPLYSSNNVIIGFEIETENDLNPLTVESLKFNTTGSIDVTDIANARIFYTGNLVDFATTNQFGADVASPDGEHTVTGSQALVGGTNHFWLVYDLSETATPGNLLDAQFVEATIDGTTHTATVSRPAGYREIGNVYTMKTSDFSVTQCGIVFTDDGGLDKNYEAGFVDAFTTFHPVNATDKVKIEFSSFSTEAGYDYMYIHDGNSTAAPLIGQYDGTNTPGTVTSTATDGSLTVRFYSDGSVNDIGWNALVTCIDNTPMSVVSTSVTQSEIPTVDLGAINQQIIRVAIETDGLQSPLSLETLEFDMNGTTNLSDITNARVFYTGSDPALSTTTQFGTDKVAPTATFAVSGTQELSSGVNYFWLVYDIDAGATPGDFADASCTNIGVSGTDYTPDNASPSGNQKIDFNYCDIYNSQFVANYISNVQLNTLANNSGDEAAYNNYTNLSTELERSRTYQLQSNIQINYGGYNNTYKVFIDWNQDGSFDPATEIVVNQVGDNSTVNANITVPQDALLGSTRMRVINYLGNFANIDACGDMVYGEAEDYTLNIIEKANAAPFVKYPLADLDLDEGFATKDVDVTYTFDDEDGDNLTFSVLSDNPSAVSAAVNGNTVTLSEVANGVANITVTAYDGNGGSANETFEVTVTAAGNTAPYVFNSMPDKTEDQGYGSFTIDLTTVFTDDDGDDLNYTISSSDESVATVSVLNDVLTVTDVSFGETNISVAVNDGKGGQASDAFLLTVIAANRAPQLTSTLADIDKYENFGVVDVDFTGLFVDPDMDDLTYSVELSEAGVVTSSIDGTTLTLTEAGVGTVTVTLTANDPDGLSVSESFVINVAVFSNDAPVVAQAIADINETPGFGSADVEITNTFSDADGDNLTYTVSSSNESVATVSLTGTTLTVTEAGSGQTQISVLASDGNGGSVTETFMVYVNAAPVVANAIADQAKDEGFSSFTIDLDNVFSDADGDMLSYSANSTNAAIVAVSLNGSTLTVSENGLGTATVTVTANDGNSGTVSDDFSVTVNNVNDAPIVANAISDQNQTEGFVSSAIDFTNVFTDPDGDALTYSATVSPAGVVTTSITGTTITVTEVANGTTTVSLKAEDAGGLFATERFVVNVSAVGNTAPTLDNAISDVVENEGFASTTVDITNTFSDFDSDPLSYTLTSSNENVATVSVTGTTITITEVGNGNTDITVLASDGNGGSVSDVFNVKVNNVNDAPVVANAISDVTKDEYFGTHTIDLSNVFTDEDGDVLVYTAVSNNNQIVAVAINGNELNVTEKGIGSTTVTVYANDGKGGSVPDDFTFTVNNVNDAPVVVNAIADQNKTEGYNSFTISLTNVFADKDNDALTYSAVSSNPAVATVSVTGSTLTITDVEGGSTNITVTANDGNEAGSDIFTLIVTNVNDAPVVANAIADQSKNEGFGSFTLDIASVFTDSDGDALTYTVSSGSTSVVTVSLTGTTLTVTEVGNGSSNITVTANDGNGGSMNDVFSVTVNNVNDTPVVANAIAEQVKDEGFGSFTISLANVFSDEDGDALSYTVTSSATNVATVSISGTTLTVTEVGNGSSNITVTANDGNGGSMNDVFTLTVVNVNDVPALVSEIPDQTLTEGFGTITVDVSAFFADEDGDVLTFSLENTNTDVITVSVDAGIITITEVGVGTTTITVTVDDGNGGTISDSFDVTVNSGTAIDKIEANSFVVYPNPSNGKYMIQFETAQKLTFEVISISGKVVLRKEANAENVDLDITQQSSGMYFLRIISQNNTASTVNLIKK